MNVTKTDWFFIVNPHAGSGKTMSEWVPAEKKFYKLGIPYTTAYTDHKRHAVTLAYEAAAAGYRKILTVGGDGSLHETYNGIMAWCDENGADPAEFTLAVAPIGSGNDWIKSLGVPHDPGKVVDMIAGGSFGIMDVIKLESEKEDGTKGISYMANIGGTGFDSHVCERVNRQKERGYRNKMIYLNALRLSIAHLKANSLKVYADGREVFSGNCYSIALGNGRYSGSGMLQVPRAEIDDGIMDVTIVPKIPLLSIIKEIPRLFTGNLDESDNVICLKCKTLQIVPMNEGSKDLVELDGEIEGHLPATLSVTGKHIGVIKSVKRPDDLA